MALIVKGIKGVVVLVPDYKSGISSNDYEWRKSTMVIDIEGPDSKSDHLSVVGFMKIADIMKDMNLNKGDNVSVDLLIKSRKWNGNYYTDIYVDDIRFDGRHCEDTNFVNGLNVSKEVPFFVEEDDLPF